MASTPSALLSTALVDALRDVSTGTATIMASGVNQSNPLDISHMNMNLFVGTNNGSQYVNGSTEMTKDNSIADFPTWLSVRLLIIAFVLVGIVLLACGSYAIHKRCFKHRRTKFYKSTLLV